MERGRGGACRAGRYARPSGIEGETPSWQVGRLPHHRSHCAYFSSFRTARNCFIAGERTLFLLYRAARGR
jgi:hypothetical protein